MTHDPLIIGIPSKGRIHEAVAAWLKDAGLALRRGGASRGYTAALAGIEGVEVRLISAGEVASSLASGQIHVGVTGLDLLHERAGGLSADLQTIARLGFARADVVVAVPDCWIDVDTMDDLRDVALRYHETTRARLRVATKFRQLTRRFFDQHGILDYHIVESLGATEGAPGADVADLIVDITETGSTLRANQLKVLDDGIMMKSEAVLVGAISANWSRDKLASFGRFMGLVEARATAKQFVEIHVREGVVSMPDKQMLEAAWDCRLLTVPGSSMPGTVLCPLASVQPVCAQLQSSGAEIVSVLEPRYVFESASAELESFRQQVLRYLEPLNRRAEVIISLSNDTGM